MIPNKSSQKRFFWLKLYHDFFNRDEIRIIESQPNGKDYIIFYLKLMLKSINDNGKLLFKDTIPYTPEMLASITNTSIDTVRVAIDAFAKLGLITMLDDGALFMQEVQKMVGSETADAERMRVKRAADKSQLKLTQKNKKQTQSEHCSKNVTLENKSIELKSKDNIPPYIPHSDNSNNKFGVIGIWLEHIADIGLSFTDDEILAISEFAKYKSESGQSITSQQIKLILQNLNAHKKTGYDICRMIRHSIASGYKGVMTPTKDFLINVNKPVVRTGKYPSSEYITPENQAQKYDLRNYLERCYMRDMVDPRTGTALTDSQKSLFNAHFLRCKSMSISITDYIYRNEVMTGICLLDQP
ncbi:MAG: phage replisome organizer N-terminal domain-containing protein [Burkholderiales bacterium]|nr:phage replisome organizer N-terminal domain-containing protein [Burkholderiales bacterium]